MFASAERYDCSPPIKAGSLSTEECKHKAYSLVPSYHSTTLEFLQYIHTPCLVQDVVDTYIFWLPLSAKGRSDLRSEKTLCVREGGCQNMRTKRLPCEKFAWERGKRRLMEQRWQGWVSKSRLGMDPRRGDWLSQPQMEDGAHRKRINCLISARWGTGLLLADRLLREEEEEEEGGGGQ